MKTSLLFAVTLAAGAPLAASAQRPFPTEPPKTWASVYGVMYTDISSLRDPATESRWAFDDNAFGLGAALHRRVAEGLMLGIDATYARPKYEQRSLEDDVVLESGTASVATAMANGRYGGGSGEIGFYLTGGIGTVAYRLEHLDSWNADFGLRAGTGLEYRFRRNLAAALEWGRTWGYHEKEDLGGGSQTHSSLKLSARFGF